MEMVLLIPVLKAALAGALVAASTDFLAFRKFKSLTEFKAYNWRVAAFRWGQGAVVGVLGYFGLGQMVDVVTL